MRIIKSNFTLFDFLYGCLDLKSHVWHGLYFVGQWLGGAFGTQQETFSFKSFVHPLDCKSLGLGLDSTVSGH